MDCSPGAVNIAIALRDELVKAAKRIQKLESQNAELSGKIGRLQAERDAAVADVYRSCLTCKKLGKSEYLNTMCNECIGWRNWQWRGVQKEEAK